MDGFDALSGEKRAVFTKLAKNCPLHRYIEKGDEVLAKVLYANKHHAICKSDLGLEAAALLGKYPLSSF